MNATRSQLHHLITTGVLTLTLTLGLVTAACGSSEGGGQGGGSVYDQSGATLKPFEIDVKGQAITVSLPDTMVPEADSPFIRYLPAGDTQFGVPTFTFSFELLGPPSSPDDLVLQSQSTANTMIVTKRAEVAGGFLIGGHNDRKSTVEVGFVKVNADGKAISCRAVQARSAGIPNPEKTLEMFERACTSMALK